MQLPAVIEYLNESTLSATPLARGTPRPDIASSCLVSAQFSHVRISGAFQPVMARRDQRVIGYPVPAHSLDTKPVRTSWFA